MIDDIIKRMSQLVKNLQESIKLDIEDIKKANHEGLLSRNDEKLQTIDEISSLKVNLNEELMKKIQEGLDVNIYRQKVDFLENQLKELYELNKKLAAIVLPVQQMYKELVEDITAIKGGNIFDIKA